MPKVKTTATNRDVGVASLGPGVVIKTPRPPRQRNQSLRPSLSIEGRKSDFVKMMADPSLASPAMPPCTLPARAVPIKVYQEVLLTTDASGSCGVTISPAMLSHYSTVATWSGTSIASYATGQNHSEYTSFIANFMHFIPLCYEVDAKYTGPATTSAGRFYGIVGAAGDVNVANFPREPNGCESVTAEGINCMWFSSEPVWSNPALTTSGASATEWMDPTCIVALIGGPASVTNVVSVGIWLHMVAFPKSGIVGLTPSAGLPDPNAALAAALMAADEDGQFASAMSSTRRSSGKKRIKGTIRDVLRMGGKAIATVAPQYGAAATAAGLLADLLG